MLVHEEVGPFRLERRQLGLFTHVPIAPLPLQMLRVLGVEAQVLVERDSCVLHEALLAVPGLPLPVDRVKLALQAGELLDLPSYLVASLLEFELFFCQQVSLLVDPLFDALQGNFAANGQRVALEDISAPLDSVPLNVRQELLEQNAFVV